MLSLSPDNLAVVNAILTVRLFGREDMQHQPWAMSWKRLGHMSLIKNSMMGQGQQKMDHFS